MTIAYWCVFIMMLFPYIFSLLARHSMKIKDVPGQRDYSTELTGWERRAHFIHLNSFEIFPLFAISVVIAHQLHATQSLLDILAVVFVILRIVYAVCYLKNTGLMRTLFFVLGLICIFIIFFSSFIAVP